MSYNALLIHTCTISRRVYGAADIHGQPVETWAAIATNVPCRLTWQSELYMTQEWYQNKVVSVARYVLFLPKGQDVLVRDRITTVLHKSGAIIDAGPFDVLEANTRSDKHGPHHVELLLSRILEGGT